MRRMDKSWVFESTYYPVTLITFCVTMLLYRKVVPLFGTKITKSYTNLSVEDRHSWNFRFVSCFHSLLVSVACFYTLLCDEVVSNDPVWSDRPLVRLNCAMVSGFFMADTVSLVLDYEQNMDTFKYYVHHAATIYAFYYVYTYGVMPYFANFRLMTVLSTAFVNIRWMFDKANVDRSSTMYVLHRRIAAVTFILTRIFSIPFYWYTVYTYIGSEDFALLGNKLYVMIITCVPLDVLNVLWGIGIIKSVCKGSRSSSCEIVNGISKT
ncbi:TLC domain-containing protein 4-B-like [Argopecten irradians]|uniref:TLC domain-containing protein 4-B-like n=1 Tax=Argopecten irradians TaxID=31199 RepID=UPI003720A936